MIFRFKMVISNLHVWLCLIIRTFMYRQWTHTSTSALEPFTIDDFNESRWYSCKASSSNQAFVGVLWTCCLISLRIKSCTTFQLRIQQFVHLICTLFVYGFFCSSGSSVISKCSHEPWLAGACCWDLEWELLCRGGESELGRHVEPRLEHNFFQIMIPKNGWICKPPKQLFPWIGEVRNPQKVFEIEHVPCSSIFHFRTL